MADAPQLQNPETALMRIWVELSRRSWNLRDLANASGFTYRRTRNLVSGCEKTPSARAKIEKTLRKPIWSTPEEFAFTTQPSQNDEKNV